MPTQPSNWSSLRSGHRALVVEAAHAKANCSAAHPRVCTFVITLSCPFGLALQQIQIPSGCPIAEFPAPSPRFPRVPGPTRSSPSPSFPPLKLTLTSASAPLHRYRDNSIMNFSTCAFVLVLPTPPNSASKGSTAPAHTTAIKTSASPPATRLHNAAAAASCAPELPPRTSATRGSIALARTIATWSASLTPARRCSAQAASALTAL